MSGVSYSKVSAISKLFQQLHGIRWIPLSILSNGGVEDPSAEAPVTGHNEEVEQGGISLDLGQRFKPALPLLSIPPLSTSSRTDLGYLYSNHNPPDVIDILRSIESLAACKTKVLICISPGRREKDAAE